MDSEFRTYLIFQTTGNSCIILSRSCQEMKYDIRKKLNFDKIENYKKSPFNNYVFLYIIIQILMYEKN